MRRAYRRPISKAEVDGPMAFYREGRADGDFDAGIGKALSAVLINPEFLLPRRRRSEESAGRWCLPNQRSRAGVATVVLPVEQHPGRRAARRGDSRQAQPSRRAREADAQNARRSALVQPRDQLRRTVAAAAQSRGRHAELAPVSRLRRQRASGVPAGNRALPRQRAARRSQRARFDQDRLHVPQRAAGEDTTEFPTSTEAASAA